MKRFAASIGVLVAIAASPLAVGAADQIRTHSQGVLRGRITEISPLEVKIDAKPLEIAVKVNDIVAVRFEDEPAELARARVMSHGGQHAEAVKLLEGIDNSTISRREIVQDIEYLAAYCTAQQALGGSANVGTAGNLLLNFVKQNPSSYHFLEANELVGDLYVAAGAYDRATPYYETAAKAPWRDAELRIDVKRGQAMLAQSKTSEAAQLFEKALATDAKGPQVEGLKLSALLGKASALTLGNKADEGIKLVEDVIYKADKTDTELHAQAYLTLGHCYRAVNKPRDAVLAYLHVDLLYFQHPKIHAEALSWLARLWQQLNKPDRARDAATRLAKSYPNSRWAKAGQ